MMSTIDNSSARLWGRMESRAGVVNPRRLRRFPISAQLGNLPHSTLPSCLALAAIALCTWASFHFGQGFAFTGFLYLVFVVLTAMYGGFWQATFISVVAASCLNYFFVPPIFSFVNSAENWVALGAFEFTALVISRLSLRAQVRANEAIAERRDMERLYQTSRRILLLDSSREPGNLITALIQEIFALQAVQLFEERCCKTYRSGECPPQGARDAYLLGQDVYDAQAKGWYCVIRAGKQPIGGLALYGTEMNKLAATALASLTGIALERVRVIQEEYRAQAARQTEQLRTSVLDALAHQFKTPLTIARTASSGLLAVGGLSELQMELAATFDQQARKLDDIATRLLSAAAPDCADLKPQCQALLVSHLVRAAIDELESPADRERFRVAVPGGEIPLFGDRKLILTSISQLLDNAIKYSEPKSLIDAVVAIRDSTVVLTIRNKGLVIAPADRELVFERFYRAPHTQHMPAGTGLGLSIVKRIVEVHQGRVWAEGEPGHGTAFSISLPAVRQ
jgi:two-component system sensor histidine kinase KdpD